MRSEGQEKANFLPILEFQWCTNASVWSVWSLVRKQESGILCPAFAVNFLRHQTHQATLAQEGVWTGR